MKSLDSIDKSFEERFDPKKRSIGVVQLQNYDSKKEYLPSSKYFRIEFSTSIPEDTKFFLNEQLPRILDFSDKFGLQIPHANHVLRFIDQPTYEGELSKFLPKTVTLPASRLKIINTARSYEVTVILPREFNTAEVIVNITRNLFSKLCGNIFFNEQILPLEFYQHSSQGEKQVSAAIPEVLFLVEELNVHSKRLEEFCENVANSYRLDMKKEGTKIRKQLILEWREKWTSQSLSTEEKDTLDAIFSEIKQIFHTNPEELNQSLVERIEQLNTQLHFILPHERSVYKNFKQKRFPHYIRSVKNKLEEISALSGFIEELHNLLNLAPKVTDIKGVGAQIRLRMKELRRDKKVIEFYVPELPHKPELKRIHQRFPLSLIKMLPSGTPLKEWSKEIKRLEKYYTESIYSKLYAALHSLSEWTLAIQEKRGDSFKESVDGQHLKKLLPVLKYRAPSIKGLQSTIGVLLDLSEQSAPKTIDNESHRHLVPLDDFSKAWSYFISSILSMLYYQQSSASATLPQGFRTENYLKSILKFVDRQCLRGINYFHIVKLLFLVYEKKGTDALPFLLYCVQKPQDILRYTLHLTMSMQTEQISIEKRLEKLPQYRDAWIYTFQSRLNESGN